MKPKDWGKIESEEEDFIKEAKQNNVIIMIEDTDDRPGV
jgi:hypothetical protein